MAFAKSVIISYRCTMALSMLGDSNYNQREYGEQVLTDYGFQAVPILKLGLESKDCEVRERCNHVLLGYYSKALSLPVSPIWYMADDLRFSDGKDYAKEWYLKAYRIMRPVSNLHGDIGFTDDEVAKTATRMWFKDQLDKSDCRDDIGFTNETMYREYDKLSGGLGYSSTELDSAGVPMKLTDRWAHLHDEPKPITEDGS